MLLALMAEGGAFGEVLQVSTLAHMALGAKPEVAGIAMEEYPLARVSDELLRLLNAYLDPDKGYAARRVRETLRWLGDYDHLSRFGEWAASDLPLREVVE